MYIPQGFMGTYGGCITASVTPINGNGVITTGSFISGSDIYDYARFEMSSLTNSALTSFTASLNIISGAVSNVNLLIVGGGAGGSSSGSIFPVGSVFAYEVNGGSPGGGGGVVYYNNLTLSPGTYQIGVGAAANRGVAGGTNTWTGSNGNQSYFTYNQPWPQFNTPNFIAYGGGFGGAMGWETTATPQRIYYRFQYGNSNNSINEFPNNLGIKIASGGGNFVRATFGGVFETAPPMGINPPFQTDGLGGFTPTNQGNAGGYYGGGEVLDGWNGYYCSGAGGAGGIGQSVGSGSGLPFTTRAGNGGAGVTYRIGNQTYTLSGGGAGRGASSSTSTLQSGSRGSTSYGAGGSAYWRTNSNDTFGNAGLVVIEWKRCLDQKCDTVDVSTLASPLTMSFIKCGESTTSSLLLEPFNETTICTLSGSISVISGPTTTITSVGNCLNYTDNPIIPIPFTFLRYDVAPNCNLSNPTEVFSYINYTDGFYIIDGTLYNLQSNTHTTYTTEITSATPSTCTAPFPISGVILWNDTTSLTGSVWYDKSLNGNNGLVSGSTLTLSGSLGYAFNGTNNYVTYPITLVGQPSSSYTLQYYGSLPSESVNRDFFVKEVYSNGWDLIFDGASSPDRFVFRDNAGSDKRANISTVLAEKQLITITANENTDLMELYVNSAFVTNFTAGAVNNFNASAVPFVFGFNTNGDATYWKGGVSDLLLYNKVLSATEVSQSFAYLSLGESTCRTWFISGGTISAAFTEVSYVNCSDVSSSITVGRNNTAIICAKSGSTPVITGQLGNGSLSYVGALCE